MSEAARPSVAKAVREWPATRVLTSYGLLPLVIVAACAFFAHEEPLFIAPRNLVNVLTQSSYLVMLAAAQMMVLLVRGFDLSAGTVLSAISVVIGLVMTGILHLDPNAPWLSVGLAIAVALLIGLAVGLINGACVVGLGVNPFVVTLGTQGVAAGLAATISGGFPIYGLPVQLTSAFSRGSVLGIPAAVVACAILLVCVHLLLNLTTLGRGLYLLGSNPRAAAVAGLPTRRYTLSAYVLCSGMVAIVAVLLTARTGSGEPNLGGGLMLQSIAAAVIGGVSLRGGQGGVLSCILGGVFITVLSNGMDLTQIDSFLQMVVQGAVLVAAVFIDRVYAGARSV